jgi:hypothetical protein
MRQVLTRCRIDLIVAAVAAFSAPLLAPTPAAAWWYHRGYGWNPGWRVGGWRRPGWGYGRPAPSSVWLPRSSTHPPVVVHGVWVPGYWHGGHWVAGGWR